MAVCELAVVLAMLVALSLIGNFKNWAQDLGASGVTNKMELLGGGGISGTILQADGG